ncbi:MAG TPA: CoA pyrophosphatase [Candidatus Bathyarchaeota archaeon]|nr:CoA pyrophosphatase [Candidatus Bathyarchaeota archaeon]
MENAEKLSKVLKLKSEDLDANAAVAVLLRVSNQEFQVLFVKRAVKSGDPWSGQTAFPGGKRDPEDRNLKETVVRETLEETGINILVGCRFLGAMEPVRSTQKPEMQILPFVVLLEKKQKIKLNEELTEHFWTPLKELAKHEGTVKLRSREYPAYIIENHIIWGLTYKILQNLLSIFASIRKEETK